MSKEIVRTEHAPKAIGPYSQAAVAGGFVFVSGQIAIDPVTGKVSDGDIRGQSRIVLENAKAILGAAGCILQNVVKVTIFLKDMGDFGAVNEVYAGYFPVEPPARATVEVSRLPKDVLVEMDFVAFKG